MPAGKNFASEPQAFGAHQNSTIVIYDKSALEGAIRNSTLIVDARSEGLFLGRGPEPRVGWGTASGHPGRRAPRVEHDAFPARPLAREALPRSAARQAQARSTTKLHRREPDEARVTSGEGSVPKAHDQARVASNEVWRSGYEVW